MATSKKSTAKKATTKKSTASKPSAPKKPSYEELVAARREMDAAHERVASAERVLRSANTYLGDFTVRDQMSADARKALEKARSEAVAASSKFQELKYGSK